MKIKLLLVAFCLSFFPSLAGASSGQNLDLIQLCQTPITMHRKGISSAKVCKHSPDYADSGRKIHRQFIQFLIEHDWKFGSGGLTQETIFVVGLDRNSAEKENIIPSPGQDVMVTQKMKSGNFRKLWISAESDGTASWLESILARVDYCDLN